MEYFFLIMITILSVSCRSQNKKDIAINDKLVKESICQIGLYVVNVFEDSNGNLWLGGAGGLYKIDLKGEIVNVTTTGPWN